MFSGRIAEVTCPRIAVLGTDSAVGKRTIATILTKALNNHGIKAVMVGTGQTGLIRGARYGVALGAIPCRSAPAKWRQRSWRRSRPSGLTSSSSKAKVLSATAPISAPRLSSRGRRPNAVILQHAPARRKLGDFADVPTPDPASEINLIHTFADTKVIGLTINHANMSDVEVTAAITMYELEFGIPATDALTRPVERLVEIVAGAFPELERKPVARAS